MAILGIIIFLALIIFIKLKMPMWKGWYSEKLVSNKMQNLPKEYVIFNDLLFESNGYSTQIDHIVVSPYGVFVIETKGYKGWILGGENNEYWTQTIYKSKHQFYNPIRQNASHVRFLRHLLKCSVNIPFIPIVVFNNDAVLNVHVTSSTVINRFDLISTILRYETPILDKNILDWIIKTIQQNHVEPNKEAVKRHKYKIKDKQYRSRNLIKEGVCPRCGSKLVLRQGKYGSFYGCSNFPKLKDMEKPMAFYHNLFGLKMIQDNDGNVIMTDGLVLQDIKHWKKFLGRECIPCNNMSELYFEEENIQAFYEKLKNYSEPIEFVNHLMTHAWGQQVIRFYDPDGNLIEVGTPAECREHH